MAWRKYCDLNSIDPWQGTPKDLLAFLHNCYKTLSSLPGVYIALNAVRYFYRLKGVAQISVGPLLKMFLKGLKRCHFEVATGTKPLTKTILDQLNDYLCDRQTPLLREFRTIWRINLAFYGVLHWKQVMGLKVLF